MEYNAADKPFNFYYDDLQAFDDSLSKKTKLDFNPFEFVSEPFFNNVLGKRIKVEHSGEELLPTLVDEEDFLYIRDPFGLVDDDNTPDSESMFDSDLPLEIKMSPSSNVQEIPASINNKDEEQLSQDKIVKFLENETRLEQYMSVEKPLSHLQRMLENRFKVNLSEFSFTLQDKQELEADNSIAELISKENAGCDIVKFVLQLKYDSEKNKKINIMDVLQTSNQEIDSLSESDMPGQDDEVPTLKENVVNLEWSINNEFTREIQKMNMSSDLSNWSKDHVRFWLDWALRQFNLSSVSFGDWDMDGENLCKLTFEEYKKIAPKDPRNLLWMHIELLKRCKILATLQEDTCDTLNNNYKENKSDIVIKKRIMMNRAIKTLKRHKPNVKPKVKSKILQLHDSNVQNYSSRGSNGQIQLWQFLLELLTDKHYRPAIQWLGNEGEFKLLNPEMVAHLWGERKNKPAMNYEKLSRALRYYYEGDMISKVHGKRFVYKFVCDLKALLGYSASELNLRVIEAEKKLMGEKDPMLNCAN